MVIIWTQWVGGAIALPRYIQGYVISAPLAWYDNQIVNRVKNSTLNTYKTIKFTIFAALACLISKEVQP